MTPREQDAYIADKLFDQIVYNEMMSGRCKMVNPPILIDPVPLPHFSTRYDAAFRMEINIEKLELTEPYILALSKIIEPSAGVYTSAIELDWHFGEAYKYLFAIAHATPIQRAQAAVEMLMARAGEEK